MSYESRCPILGFTCVPMSLRPLSYVSGRSCSFHTVFCPFRTCLKAIITALFFVLLIFLGDIETLPQIEDVLFLSLILARSKKDGHPYT